MTSIRDEGHGAGNAADALFAHLPPRLFTPLASAARHAYSRLLIGLFHRFFDGDTPGSPRKDVVVEHIRIEIERDADLAGELALENANAALSQDPLNVYRNLREAGWIQEYRQGYVIVVDIDASVSLLFETLDAINNGEALHFGGTLAAIQSVVEKLGEEPEERASSLADSAQRAKRFQQHLAAIVGSLRLYEKAIANRHDPEDRLAHFFDQFVEKTLIVDYRTLKTHNNPFRHRDSIIAAISLYESDAAMVAALARGYVDQGLAVATEEGEMKARQHLNLVKTVFWRSEERLIEIDGFRMRLERRIARTITYMSQVDATISSRLAGMIQGLASRRLAWLDEVPLDSDVTDHVRCWGPDDLSPPRNASERVMPKPMPVLERDPRITYYDRMRREYLQRLTITPAKIEHFLDIALERRAEMSGGEIEVSDTETALIFQRMRQIGAMADTDITARWKISILEGPLLETPWTTCSNFKIERVQIEGDKSHAG